MTQVLVVYAIAFGAGFVLALTWLNSRRVKPVPRIHDLRAWHLNVRTKWSD